MGWFGMAWTSKQAKDFGARVDADSYCELLFSRAHNGSKGESQGSAEHARHNRPSESVDAQDLIGPCIWANPHAFPHFVCSSLERSSVLHVAVTSIARNSVLSCEHECGAKV